MPGIPILETSRLTLRPLTDGDLDVLHEIHQRAFGDGSDMGKADAVEASKKTFDWILLNEWFPRLRWWNTRAIELRENQKVIGEIALVPMPLPLDAIISGLDAAKLTTQTMELSMVWGLLPEYRHHGYATEAAKAFVSFVFAQFNLNRIVADTDIQNIASQEVMKRLGMKLYHNRLSEFDWIEVIGVLENPAFGVE